MGVFTGIFDLNKMQTDFFLFRVRLFALNQSFTIDKSCSTDATRRESDLVEQ